MKQMKAIIKRQRWIQDSQVGVPTQQEDANTTFLTDFPERPHEIKENGLIGVHPLGSANRRYWLRNF